MIPLSLRLRSLIERGAREAPRDTLLREKHRFWSQGFIEQARFHRKQVRDHFSPE